MAYRHPEHTIPYYSSPIPVSAMDYSPSSQSLVTASEYEDSPDYDGDGGDPEDDVIVIHEHHHHHHHNTEGEEGSRADIRSPRLGEAPRLPTSEQLLGNILNDQILYDFVSFLLEETQRSKAGNTEDEERHVHYEEGLTGTGRSAVSDDYDILPFLEEGFTPIVEVELDK